MAEVTCRHSNKHGRLHEHNIHKAMMLDAEEH